MAETIHNNPALQAEVAAAVKIKGDWDSVTAQDVLDVARYGSVSESVIGSEYDDALSEAILEELDSRGIQV